MSELAIVKQAIINESEGRAFYQMAAERAENPEVKDAFLHLRNQEEKHEEWLRSLYHSIVEHRVFQLDWDTVKQLNEVESPGIFAQAPGRFRFSTLDLAVFQAGLLMEKASIDFYSKAAAETGSTEAKLLYQRLATWEEDHLEKLQRIHDTLQEEWWAQQRFSPA